MNWFGRYGIPGAYFVGIMAGWIYAFCPNLLKNGADLGPQWLLALAAITFLPIGYIISIVGQTVYLNWRRCFARTCRLQGWLGFHGAAMDTLNKLNISMPNQDEAIIEARTLLLTAERNGYLSVDTHHYIRDWIARRMDVVAINQSVIWATVLANIIALVFFISSGVLSLSAIITLIITVFVIIVMFCSIRVLRRQIIEVIAGIYRTYR